MEYVLIITEEAKRHIDKLDRVIRTRIAKKLPLLLSNPKGLSRNLVNFKGGSYRYRVGDYRIIFDINGNKIEILKVMHRREVYK